VHKNAGSYASTPQYVIIEWCLVKHMDNFNFTLPLLLFITSIIDSDRVKFVVHDHKISHRRQVVIVDM
jgi:hypothetical protein